MVIMDVRERSFIVPSLTVSELMVVDRFDIALQAINSEHLSSEPVSHNIHYEIYMW
jgi:hypothetical protein